MSPRLTYWVWIALALGLALHAQGSLTGSYSIGQNGDFLTIQSAIDEMSLEGLGGDVSFWVDPGTYAGPLVFGPIAGSEASRVDFRGAYPGMVTITSDDTTAATVTFDSAPQVVFGYFHILSPGAGQPAMRVTGSSVGTQFLVCDFIGSTTGNAVECLGSELSDISFYGCTFMRGLRGIHAQSAQHSARGLVVHKSLFDSVACGVYLSSQTNVVIRSCDIRLNLSSSAGNSGIWIENQLATDEVEIVGNRIHDFRSSAGYACGIRHDPWSEARLSAFNNFIYDFQNSGSSQVRAVFVSSGENRIVNNSVSIPDVAATGSTYAIYDGLTLADYSLELKNNILVNLEATRPAYNLFVLTPASPLESDNNIFYGTGQDYSTAWMLGDYVTLSAWSSSSGQDQNSLNGDPGFVSSNDLHLPASSSLPHQNGAIMADISYDVDGDIRYQPPDIGADEYQFAAPPFDARLLDVQGLGDAVPEGSSVVVHVVVQNHGSQQILNLPLRISVVDDVLAEVPMTLDPSRTDTFMLQWNSGTTQGPLLLTVEVIVPGDAAQDDNSWTTTVTVTGPPMVGDFTVGNVGHDYPSIALALGDLQLRGLSGDVTLHVAEGAYADPLVINAMPGSQAHCLTIRRESGAQNPVLIVPPAGQQAVLLSQVSNVTLQDLTIHCGANTFEAIRFDSGASFNAVRSCEIVGSSVSQTSATGVNLRGGCRGNLLDSLNISGTYHGIRLDGNAPRSDSGNVVTNCTIHGVRTGVYLTRQQNCRIEQCAISGGFEDAPASCYAVRVGTLASGDSVFISRNRIVGATSSGTLYGISASAGAGVVFVDNNFFADWTLTGSGYLYAVHVLSGQIYCAHNSFDLNEISGSASVIGIYAGGASAIVHLHNSILRIAESNNPAFALLLPSNVIHADYNLFEVPSANPQFSLGRIGTTNYAALSQWQNATAQDSHSFTGMAGYLGGDDLHIRPDMTNASDAGMSLPNFPTDIDGDERGATPDLGADEYVYFAEVVDASCSALEIPESPVAASSSISVLAYLQNEGTVPINDATAELFYNDSLVGSQLVALEPASQTTCFWVFTTPEADLAYGTFRLKITAVGDMVPNNDEITQSIVVTGSPLSGSALVAPTGGQFDSPGQLLEHLRWRGIDGEFTAAIAEGDYYGPWVFYPVSYADEGSRVVVMPEVGSGSVVVHAQGAEPALMFIGAHDIELRGLTILNEQSNQPAVSILQSSTSNRLVDCEILGGFPSDVLSVGVRIAERCDNNVVDSCLISGFYTGVALTCDTAVNSVGNRVAHSSISGAHFCLWADHQTAAEVHGCDMQPGNSDGIASSCYGVYAVQLGDSGSLRVEGNKVHGFVDAAGPSTNRACAIYSAPGGNNVVEIVNNFIYDYSEITNNKIRGIYVATGANFVANNSIRLDNAPTTNDICAIYCLTGTLHQLYNNCIVSYESTVASSGLYLSSTSSALSDYNCYWGSSPLFACAVVDVQTFPELSDWQATAHDAHGNDAYPHYVSSNDLHIQTDNQVLFRAGLYLPQVPTDFDGEVRFDPPCIGADEYVYQPPQLPAPESLVILAGQNSVQLMWTPVPGAAGYEVFSATTVVALDSLASLIAQTADTTLVIDLLDDSEPMRFYQVDTIEP